VDLSESSALRVAQIRPSVKHGRSKSAGCSPRTSEYIFPGEDGGQRVTIQKAVRRIRKTAGLPDTFRPLHGLRHAFASRLASSGQVDMYTLQKLLTHKSPVMTQRYAHLRMRRCAGLQSWPELWLMKP